MGFANTNGNNKIEMNSDRKHVLPRISLTKFNVLIDGRNFDDQPISDKMRKYDELRKLTTGKDDDYTTGCFLVSKYFKDHYNVIACDLSKKKELYADPRSIQQIEANFMLNNNSQILTAFEKSKETVLEFYMGKTKFL